MKARHPIIDELPPIYRDILPPFFATEIPTEEMSDCEHCTMQCHDNPLRLPGTAFYGAAKCCTYHPDLPNFLVGEILREAERDRGRQRIETVISQRLGSTPLGLFMPRRYKVVYDAMINTGFGKAASLTCPYFDAEAANCSIWRHRNAVCSTWFCKVNGRDRGRFFWDTLMNYMKHVERSLINHVLLEVGYDIHLLTSLNKRCGHDGEDEDDLTPEEIDGLPMQPEQYAAIWQQWQGREAEFFATASEIVRRLSPQMLASICGVEGQLHQARLASSLQMMTWLPPRLRLNAEPSRFNRIMPLAGDPDMVEMHLLTDDLTATVPVVLIMPLAALRLFDGSRPNGEVVARARDLTGYEFSEQMLIRLYSHEVLVDAGRHEAAGPSPTNGDCNK